MRKVDKIIFWALLAAYTGVMLYLFVMECYEVPVFRSDMPDYVNKVRGIAGDYEFPYPLFFTIAKLFAFVAGAPLGVAITTALLNALGVCVARYYMGKLLHGTLGEELSLGKFSMREEAAGSGREASITLATFALFLLGNLYSPKNTAFFGFDYAYRCMGIYTPNPIWNATYLATRPFTIICFFEAARVLRRYRMYFPQFAYARDKQEYRKAGKEYLPFAAGLFLMTVTKPSYTLVLVPLMGVLLLSDLIRSGGKSLCSAFFLCVTMIPTGLDLLYQFFGVFSGTNVKGEETGIGFAFAKVWSNFSKNIPLSIVMGMALALGVAVLNWKRLKESFVYRFAWYNYLAATAMFLCFYEKGFRMMHANFSWGYMHGMFFVFFLTVALVLLNTVEWWKSWKMIFLPTEWAVLAYHLVCGINFLVYALQGNDLAGF